MSGAGDGAGEWCGVREITVVGGRRGAAQRNSEHG